MNNQNRICVSVTDKKLLKLHMIANSIGADVETILDIALEDYISKIDKFDSQHKIDNHKTFKI